MQDLVHQPYYPYCFVQRSYNPYIGGLYVGVYLSRVLSQGHPCSSLLKFLGSMPHQNDRVWSEIVVRVPHKTYKTHWRRPYYIKLLFLGGWYVRWGMLGNMAMMFDLGYWTVTFQVLSSEANLWKQHAIWIWCIVCRVLNRGDVFNGEGVTAGDFKDC